MTTLQVENLEKYRRGRRVVNKVSLTVGRGEVVGLLGPNGAGKTTVFSIITGIFRPSAGRIFLGGTEISHLPAYKRARLGLCYLPQEPSIFRKLTVEENIMSILEFQPASSYERKDRLNALSAEFSIGHLFGQMAVTLSGGERRRVEIARALAASPIFMLLDEPFAGIDPISVADLQQIILQLKNKNIGILITDHNVQHTMEVCDRVYIINEGIILKSGTPYEIANSAEVRSTYLGEKFRLNFEETLTDSGKEKRWIPN
ncbi:MAG: LPS export ABC transporter ATP-binding protein [Thermodesulfovibrio sp. RBG_19FT_COMBO_42_12]|nr:MAG: LPS export ABC transporter ATP-binding protein [Thermodesulfovibrio sp. RBG_19FT_COMBO_42_12]